MELPNNIYKAVKPEKAIKNPLKVKTFVFGIDDAENGNADDTVNSFCSVYGALSIVLDHHKGKMIYRIIYR